MTIVVQVLKRLALSKSTYKLVGLLLVTLGFAKGSDVMGWVSTLVCIGAGGCGD
ncbi:membrane protein [Pseudomonas phage PlaquesPlease]|uniref:Membrane protein n=1 Tax=Pseudomonas phage PlaquesPlease TaxID=2762289 RepID=A0A7G8LJW1_9CAUD|nr:membrane protein [Pseudomonas phage PlaquesPlease]